jgi:hypothetical protein
MLSEDLSKGSNWRSYQTWPPLQHPYVVANPYISAGLATEEYWSLSTHCLSINGRLTHDLSSRCPNEVAVWFKTANKVPFWVKSV